VPSRVWAEPYAHYNLETSMIRVKTTLALCILLAFPLVHAQAPASPVYAQYLVDSIVRQHPQLIGVDLHTTLAGATQTTIVASRAAERIGRASDADDVEVLRTGQARIEINRKGDQNVEVELLLFDIFKQPIGTVEFTFPYKAGLDEAALVQLAAQYRDELSRRILDAESLGAPAQTDARIPAWSYAQYLIDDTLARHPEVEVLALHARTPKTGSDYPIIASNIGRIGKPAEASDMEVIQSGKPHGALDARGARYEWKVPFSDVNGTVIGVLAVVFPHTSRSEPEELQRRAETIAAEMRARVPNADALEGSYPAGRPAVRVDAIAEYDKQELGNRQNLPMTKEVSSGQALGETQDGYSEAIKNVAGVQATNSAGSSNDAFAIRGIKLNLFSNYRLDGGLPVTGVITNPIENKERVETLKGANALMFGVASPAGIINFVTKRAGARDVSMAGLAGNSFGQYGFVTDIGRRFGADKDGGIRFNASAIHLENGVRDLGGEGAFASVGADYRATSKLTFQADVEYYKRQVPEQAGISLKPAVNGVVPLTPVPDPRNLLSGRWAMYTPETTNLQGRVDYQLTSDWKVFAQAGYSGSHRHRTTTRISGYDLDTGANGTVTVQPVTNDYRNNFFRTEVLGHFGTWGVSHDLTVGLSNTARHSAASDVQNLVLPQKQNIFDPIVLDAPVYTKPGVANPPQTSRDEGLYAYDTIGLTPRVKLLLGVRAVRDTEQVGATESSSHVTSPAYGVMFDVLPTTTLFASYMEGLEAGATAPANAANANVILSPAISKQKEIGLRNSYFKGVLISASYFDITRGNAVTDPVSNIFGYSGDLSYKGIEGTLAWEINRNWRVNAAVLRLEATQNSPTQPLIDGRTPENTPDWNGNVGVSYSVASVPGLVVRGGVKAISKRPINPQNQGDIPGYSLFDMGVSYTTRLNGRRVSLQLTGDNLANRRYWNSVQTGTYGIGMDRSLKFNAKFDF
jgi:iron complex outermembrane receptor protein